MFNKALFDAGLAWLEHALVVAGLAGLADLGDNVLSLGLSQSIVVIVVAVIGALARALNKHQPKLPGV